MDHFIAFAANVDVRYFLKAQIFHYITRNVLSLKVHRLRHIILTYFLANKKITILCTIFMSQAS